MILGWLLLAILVLIIVVFVSPIHLVLAVEQQEQARFRFELRLFSRRLPRLIRVDRGFEDISPPKPPAPEAKADPSQQRRTRGRKRFRFSRDRVIAMIRDIPTAIGDTLRCIHFDWLRIRASVGFEDPADTGRLYGALCPFNQIFSGERFDICVTPDFDAARITGTAEAAFHFVPARLAWPTARFVFAHFVWPDEH